MPDHVPSAAGELYAITGKRGHGKSTAAEALEKTGRFVHINFADPLRQACATVYGLTTQEMLDPVLKEQVLQRWPYKSPREILQQVGTELFRNYLDETWVKAFERQVQAAWDDGFGVVCSDCRFLNEAQAVRRLGGKVIRVVDPRKTRTDEASRHASEMEQEAIIADWTITNDRTVRDLHNAMLMVVV